MPKIPLTKGYEATVDNVDFERVSQLKWYAMVHSNTVYACCNGRGADGRRKHIYLHRFILNAPDGVLVDHITGNGLNCTRRNLRLCSPGQNQYNRGPQSDNKSGYKGVSWSKHSYNWQARITYDGKDHFLGYFGTKEEAAAAYQVAASKHHGEFARSEVPHSKLAAMETKRKRNKVEAQKAGKGAEKVRRDEDD